MTRFARAKGSKASNERKPEEATSWSEMKMSMLAKKAKEREEREEEEKVGKAEKVRGQTEWASLGDDEPAAFKQKSNKKGGKGNKESADAKKKMKKSEAGDVTNSVERKKKKKKKPEMGTAEEKEVKVKKKRKKIKEDPEDGPKNKKKKEEVRENEEESKTKRGDENSRKEKKEKKEWRRDGGGRKQFQGWSNSQTQGRGKYRNGRDVTSPVEEIIINGEKVKIVKFQGFYVKLEDAERLKELRSEMQKAGIPRNKLECALKLERRRAEKALSRMKKFVCFHCRGHGHLLSDCPELKEKETTGTGICYKCGSGEHSASECKVERGARFQFAECFICKEEGHIARQCPDNPRGLYPKGGGCRECGDVTHLRKDCPLVVRQKEEETVTVGVRDERSLEGLEEEATAEGKKQGGGGGGRKKRRVKF